MRMKQMVQLAMLAGFVFAASRAGAQQPPAVVSTELGANLYMLSGAGGNMAVLLNQQQSLLVDAQFDYMAPPIRQALTQLQTNAAVGTLVNTHFHRDHSNGNAAIAGGKTIIAHQQVKTRLQADQKFDPKGLPTDTFIGEKQLTVAGQPVLLQTMPASHTDGDLVVWFKAQNVLHMGDLFFADRFPFIDLNSGGSVDGYIQNVATILSQVDEKTKIVPGHGPLTDKAGLSRFHQMMLQTRAEVQAMQQQGLTVEQAVAKGLSAQWQSWHWNFITEEKWIRTLYQ